MKRFLVPLFALVALTAPALSQTRALPPGEIRANGDITFGNALKLGKRDAGKTIITPDTLQILGPGSTGDVSAMTASPSPSAQSNTLAKLLGFVPTINGGAVSLLNGPKLGRVDGGYFFPGPASQTVQVEVFNPPANLSGDATAAFVTAFARPDITTVTFCGKYLITSLDVPASKRLVGCGINAASLTIAATTDWGVRVNDASTATGFELNGNLKVDKGLYIHGDYINISNVFVQYSDKCFYNDRGNVTHLSFSEHANCNFGFYSADQWVNSVILGHMGRNGSHTGTGFTKNSYGYFFTYSTQQPQAVRIIASQSYGDAYGIFFDKDVFSVNLRDLVLDGIGQTGITFNNPACVTEMGTADVYITGSFITGGNQGILLNPRSKRDSGNTACDNSIESYNHVVIRENQINGNVGISANANTRSRIASLTIEDNVFTPGPTSSTPLFLDSVYGAWVMRNSFAADTRFPTPGVDIAVAATYTGAAFTSPINPAVQVRFNRFEKPGTRVSTFNTMVSDNIGGP